MQLTATVCVSCWDSAVAAEACLFRTFLAGVNAEKKLGPIFLIGKSVNRLDAHHLYVFIYYNEAIYVDTIFQGFACLAFNQWQWKSLKWNGEQS